MATNILFTQPNMTRFYEWRGTPSLDYYNLCYNGDTNTPNSLVRVDSNGVRIRTYQTDTELTTPVISLDYDGINFFSLQRILSTKGASLGSIIRKWSLDEPTTSLVQTSFNLFFNSYSYTYDFNCLALESYWLDLDQAVYLTDKKAYFRYPDDVPQIVQVQIGNQMRIGPNNLGDYYYGTVVDKQTTGGECWLEFSTYFNAAYAIGTDCFIETSIYVFNSWAPGMTLTSGIMTGTSFNPYGTLHILNPLDLSITSERVSGVYGNVSACAFGVVENIARIGYYNKTCCLFMVNGLNILVSDVSDLDNYLASLVIRDNYYSLPEDIIVISDMVFPMDSSPIDPPIHPSIQVLQKKWREDNETYGTWNSYNYVSVLLEPEITTSNVMLEPAVTTTGSLCIGRCTLLDQYDFGWSSHTVTWSTDGDGTFLTIPWSIDPRRVDTDLNGISRVWYKTGPTDSNYDLQVCTILQPGGLCA